MGRFFQTIPKTSQCGWRGYVVNMVGRISSFSNYNMNKVTYGLHFAFENCCLTIWRQYTKRLVSFERKYHPSISVRQRGMDHICWFKNSLESISCYFKVHRFSVSLRTNRLIEVSELSKVKVKCPVVTKIAYRTFS